VPVPEHADGRGNKRYQIHLKSDSGQIFVLLVNREAADSNPVAVQVRVGNKKPTQKNPPKKPTYKNPLKMFFWVF
jgi:transcription factor E2F4/5